MDFRFSLVLFRDFILFHLRRLQTKFGSCMKRMLSKHMKNINIKKRFYYDKILHP